MCASTFRLTGNRQLGTDYRQLVTDNY